MGLISVTNAVNGQKAEIFSHKIFGISISEKLESTILISGEGGQFPIKESKEEVLKKIKSAKITYTGGTK